MHSVEQNMCVSCTETPRKSDRHTVEQCEMHIVKHMMIMSCTEKQKMRNAQCRTQYMSELH